jgi:GNAT superfamily N-acetyltransferase
MNWEIRMADTPAAFEAAYTFCERFFPGLDADAYAREKWLKRMIAASDLMPYAVSGGAVVGVVFGRVEDSGEVTVGPVAVDPAFQKCGLGRALLAELEARAARRGIRLLALGAAESAEGFYLKCGYTPYLFIQTKPPRTLAELRALNPGYPEARTCDDGMDVRLMLATGGIDKALQRAYDAAFHDCATQTVFMKELNLNA